MIEHLHQTPESPARVVALGASGFVGGALVSHLRGLGVDTVPLSSSDVDLCRPESVDLLKNRLRKDDALVFISALTPDRGRDIRTLMKNLAMGEHVCEALSASPCAHVVYVSSDAVYADDVNPVRETSCCSPSGFHGLMHLAREQMLSFTLVKSGTPLLILRPSLLYGAKDTHNGYGPNRFLRQARGGQPVTLFGQGEEKRDHVHVEDVARLIGLGLTHRSRGALNVATGASVSFMDAARAIFERLGVEANLNCLPRSQPITHRHFDVALTHRAYPSFVYTSLTDGLAKTLSDLNNL